MIIKNWKDAKEYEYLNDAKGYQWRWEFLRRNPEYQKDWNSLNTDDNTAKASKDICEKWKLQYMVNPELDDIEKTLANYSELPFGVEWKGTNIAHESYFQTGVKRLCIDKPDFKTVCEQNKKPGGKTFLVQPICFPNMKNFIYHPEDKLFDYFTPGTKPENPAYAAFNLDEPIRPQIEAVRKELIRLQKRKKQPRGKSVSVWRRRLRLYDAKHTEPKPSGYDIAITFYRTGNGKSYTAYDYKVDYPSLNQNITDDIDEVKKYIENYLSFSIQKK